MVHVLVITHGSLSEGLRDTSEMIIGSSSNLYTISLKPGMGHEDLTEQIDEVRSELSPQDELLILLDLLGGSPAIACARALQDDVSIGVITGVNLPMFLEVMMNREKLTLRELVDLAMMSGKEGILNLRETLKDQL
ncbi:MAG: PTS sugar transporter subunit IIA [Anaerolineales bacterium]